MGKLFGFGFGGYQTVNPRRFVPFMGLLVIVALCLGVFAGASVTEPQLRLGSEINNQNLDEVVEVRSAFPRWDVEAKEGGEGVPYPLTFTAYQAEVVMEDDKEKYRLTPMTYVTGQMAVMELKRPFLLRTDNGVRCVCLMTDVYSGQLELVAAKPQDIYGGRATMEYLDYGTVIGIAVHSLPER